MKIMTQTITFSAQEVGTVRPMVIDTKGIVERVKGISLTRIYRKQLKVCRRMAQVIDRHAILSNIWIGGWVAVGAVAFFFFA